jgi:hypothetical protein
MLHVAVALIFLGRPIGEVPVKILIMITAAFFAMLSVAAAADLPQSG